MDFFMIYIVPILLALGLGGVMALALSFFSIKLKVQKDERIVRVRENLPGANCGACGFAGCDAYAEALVKGATTIDKCRPSKKDAKDRITEILDIKPVSAMETKAVVHCNGGNYCRDKGGYQGYGDCRSADLLAGGNKACEVGCMGLGACTKSCQYEAVSVCKDTGVAVVNRDRCIMCGACVDACPKGLITPMPETSSVYIACSNTCNGKTAAAQCDKSCIACGICAKVCPHGAVEVRNNLAVIDYSKCTSCGECVRKCPRECILTR